MAQFFRFIHLAVLNHLVVLSSLPDYRSYQNGFELHLTLIRSLGFDGSLRADGGASGLLWAVDPRLRN